MALKEQKLPSPAEITQQAQQQDQQNQQVQQPQQQENQSQDTLKFSEEEMKTLRGLQGKMTQIVNAFGQMKIAELRLENQLDSLKEQLATVQKEESDLAKSLSTKYGKGSLNAETGEFTPTN